MVTWWMDVVVWIVVGKKTNEAFDVGRTNGEHFLPSEGGSLTPPVKLHLEALDELHMPAQMRMLTLLVWKDPAVGVTIVVMVGLKKNYQKRMLVRKELSTRRNKMTEHNDRNKRQGQHVQKAH